jgi:serine/threonine-protein phosphatase PP1 catalytic subunit
MSESFINNIKGKINSLEMKSKNEEEKNEELNNNGINTNNFVNQDNKKEICDEEEKFEEKNDINDEEKKINNNDNNIINNEIKEENKTKIENDEEENKNEINEEEEKEEKEEEDEKEEDEKEEEEKQKEDENEEKSEENSLKVSKKGKKELDKPKKNSLKIAEKEIEESCDRITRLKERLIESRKGDFCCNVKLTEREIFTVIDKVYPIIEAEQSMLELEPPIFICGDIHGQFYDLLRVFDILKYPPESKFLFLGDYVDRGKKSLECILLLLCLKIKYPSRIFLLRGNHESADVNRTYGFYDECKRKVSVKIYKKFCNLFNILPITALVGEKILCMHGGLAYDLKDIKQLREIKRPTEIPDAGLLCDLVWSDPDDCLCFDFCTNKERGISVCFSKSIVEKFTKDNDLDLICRAHQVVEEGFQFFANMKLITVFTAPNYMGEFDNKGGILKVNEDMVCSLCVLKPNISNIGNKKRRKIDRYIN